MPNEDVTKYHNTEQVKLCKKARATANDEAQRSFAATVRTGLFFSSRFGPPSDLLLALFFERKILKRRDKVPSQLILDLALSTDILGKEF